MSDRKLLKGEASPLMPFLGLLIMTLMFGTMSVPIQEFFSSEMDESIGDLDRVVTAKSSAQLYFYNYVPTAATYSAYQTSYDLAKEGGGENIDWSSDLYTEDEGYPGYVYNPGQTCSTMELLNRIECKLGDNVTENLQENRISGSSEGRCERPDYDLDVYFSQENYSLQGGAYAFSPIETRCDFPSDGSVRYQANNSFLSLDFDVSGNRYITLAEEADRALNGLYEEWSSDVEDHYVATETQCNVEDYETAEEEAVDDAESDITQAFESAPSGSPIEDIVFQAREITGPSTTFSEDTSTDIFKGSDSQDSSVVGSCNCDEDGDNCDPVYEAEVNVTVQRSDVKLVLIDEFSKIPVDLGKRTMEFRVDSYEHFYQED